MATLGLRGGTGSTLPDILSFKGMRHTKCLILCLAHSSFSINIPIIIVSVQLMLPFLIQGKHFIFPKAVLSSSMDLECSPRETSFAVESNGFQRLKVPRGHLRNKEEVGGEEKEAPVRWRVTPRTHSHEGHLLSLWARRWFRNILRCRRA